VVVAPGQVHEFAVDRHTVDQRVAIVEVGFSLPNAAISVGHTNVKSFGQRTALSTCRGWTPR